MLQGWQESKGARIEHYIATKIGMPIMYEKAREGLVMKLIEVHKEFGNNIKRK